MVFEKQIQTIQHSPIFTSQRVNHANAKLTELPLLHVFAGFFPRDSQSIPNRTYSWFSHDVTKIQTKKLSLLLSFYFHAILEPLKTFIQNKFSVQKGTLFCDTGRLNFQAFAWQGILFWRPRKLFCGLKMDFWRFCYLNIPCLRINIALIFVSSSSEEFTHK